MNTYTTFKSSTTGCEVLISTNNAKGKTYSEHLAEAKKEFRGLKNLGKVSLIDWSDIPNISNKAFRVFLQKELENRNINANN